MSVRVQPLHRDRRPRSRTGRGQRAGTDPTDRASPAAGRQILRAAGLDPALLAAIEDRLAVAADGGHRLDPVLSHLLTAGGKRIRACLVLACAAVAGARPPGAPAADAAALVELVHAGTLLHDDVIDAARRRRGAVAANVRWGERTAVGAGTLAFARAAELAADLGPDATALMARTLAALCEGEYLETRIRHESSIPTVDEYLTVVECKTARLVAAACELGASVSDGSATTVAALSTFGRRLGLAYQIADDIIDLTGDPETTGKDRGADLREGVVTLPVLLALEDEPDGRLAALVARRTGLGRPEVDEAVAATRAAGGIDRARAVAERFATAAAATLTELPPSAPRQALLRLARGAPERLR